LYFRQQATIFEGKAKTYTKAGTSTTSNGSYLAVVGNSLHAETQLVLFEKEKIWND
jgi:hypothetical protein